LVNYHNHINPFLLKWKKSVRIFYITKYMIWVHEWSIIIMQYHLSLSFGPLTTQTQVHVFKIAKSSLTIKYFSSTILILQLEKCAIRTLYTSSIYRDLTAYIWYMSNKVVLFKLYYRRTNTTCSHCHKTLNYKFCTRTWKTSNRSVISNKYSILIGWFLEYEYETRTR
jgi:hypothetical protein